MSLLAFITLLTACLSGNDDTAFSPEDGSYSSAPGEYKIGASDDISISVWDNEHLDRSLTVRPDGMITIPLMGELYVIGMTPSELQDRVEEGLAEYINVIDGQVSVVVDDVHSYTVSVLGNVRDPGRIEFKSQVTILDALAAAGGFTEFASTSKILVIRDTQDGEKRVRFDYNEVLDSGNNSSRLVLLPGDVVLVP